MPDYDLREAIGQMIAMAKDAIKEAGIDVVTAAAMADSIAISANCMFNSNNGEPANFTVPAVNNSLL